MTVRVLIADDQQLVRAGFQLILSAQPDIEVVAEAATGLEAVEQARATQPDVVLMDIQMPGVDGIEATRRIIASGPSSTRVVILTTYDLDEYVYDALRAGASGFLLKDVPPEQLTAGIRMVCRGDALLAPSVTQRLIAEFTAPRAAAPSVPGMERLSPREREVLLLLARGWSNQEIADHLVVGETTVKTHVTRILNKLGLRDRVQAVVLAYEAGIVIAGWNTP
ncbi:MAG TPA: response regulator transcription factor [Acidimicrobiales bacterium]|jgi:DNA-binding NarL/FixJ family response regulator|nr:response regulator transcription factor [Acidimicrobiales bacterium]